MCNIVINIGTFEICIKEGRTSPHKYFYIWNPKVDGIFNDNILKQECRFSLMGFSVRITRNRFFKDIRDITRFLNNYHCRIGYWNWRNDMWYS